MMPMLGQEEEGHLEAEGRAVLVLPIPDQANPDSRLHPSSHLHARLLTSNRQGAVSSGVSEGQCLAEW